MGSLPQITFPSAFILHTKTEPRLWRCCHSTDDYRSPLILRVSKAPKKAQHFPVQRLLTLNFGGGPLRRPHVGDGALPQELQRYPLPCELVLADPHLPEAALAQKLVHLAVERTATSTMAYT